MLTHIAWDKGAINAGFEEVLGISLPQQTTKTLCGKRVVMNKIDNDGHHTCTACSAKIERERAGRQAINTYLREHGIETIPLD